MSRLTDNAKQLWFIEYGKTKWNPWRIMFSTGDDEYTRNSITVYLFGHIARVSWPQLFKPYSEKVMAHSWDAETVKKLGRNFYYDVHEKEYGFSIDDSALHIHYGAQTHSSCTTKSKVYFLPWCNMRFHRHSLYDAQCKHFETSYGTSVDYDMSQCCPSVSFLLEDYDGEKITAKTVMEERHWKHGTGWFRWLSLFRKDVIRTSLDIRFDKETGKEKRSWKGGTMGCGIDMLPHEIHEDAMRRYCEKEHRSKGGSYKIKFIGATP